LLVELCCIGNGWQHGCCICCLVVGIPAGVGGAQEKSKLSLHCYNNAATMMAPRLCNTLSVLQGHSARKHQQDGALKAHRVLHRHATRRAFMSCTWALALHAQRGYAQTDCEGTQRTLILLKQMVEGDKCTLHQHQSSASSVHEVRCLPYMHRGTLQGHDTQTN
jgi:hypothetical protein